MSRFLGITKNQNRWLNCHNNASVYEFLPNAASDRATKQSAFRLTHIYQQTDQRDNRSIDQPTSRPTDHPTTQPPNQPTKRPNEISINRQLGQPSHRLYSDQLFLIGSVYRIKVLHSALKALLFVYGRNTRRARVRWVAAPLRCVGWLQRKESKIRLSI
uniref:Uncharacterized protein n=1 Tax=Glossina brevipalpis TaxID=37001 RepID=A0A1A9WCP5_9MUSC